MIAYIPPEEPPFHSTGKSVSKQTFEDNLKKYGSYTKIPQKEKNKTFELCGRSEVKDLLFAASSGKCVYCELNPSDTGSRENDHFLPKSSYHDLAFDWGNYLPCCRNCNMHKNDQDPNILGAFKPGSEDPRPHLQFDSMKIEPHPSSSKFSEIDQLIKMCKLNRKSLLKSRSIVLIDLMLFEDALSEALNSYEKAKTARTKNSRLSTLRSALENVQSYSLMDQAHSAMSAYYLAKSKVVEKAMKHFE